MIFAKFPSSLSLQFRISRSQHCLSVLYCDVQETVMGLDAERKMVQMMDDVDS